MEKLVVTPIPKRVKVQQKWTYQENIKILKFLKNTIRTGQAIEKPTARIYYERLLRDTKILRRNPILLKNKVRNFATSYKKAVAWRNSINCQEEDNESAVQAKLKKICPFFKELDDIWGSKAKSGGTSSSMSFGPVISTEEFGHGTENSDPFYDLEDVVDVQILEPDEHNNLPLFDDTLETTGMTSPVHSLTESIEFHDHPPTIVDESPLANNDTSSLLSDGSKSSYQKLSDTPAARIFYKEAILERERYNNSKLEIERSKLELERQRLEFDQQFQRKRLEFKKQKHHTEIALRERELEVRKRELELQVLRWQFDLVRQPPK